MTEPTYGRTKTGKAITDEMIEAFAAEAERGYVPGELRGRRRGPGRPPLGSDAKVTQSFRMEPALQAEAVKRAAADGVPVSEVVRRALRDYLHTV